VEQADIQFDLRALLFGFPSESHVGAKRLTGSIHGHRCHHPRRVQRQSDISPRHSSFPFQNHLIFLFFLRVSAHPTLPPRDTLSAPLSCPPLSYSILEGEIEQREHLPTLTKGSLPPLYYERDHLKRGGPAAQPRARMERRAQV